MERMVVNLLNRAAAANPEISFVVGLWNGDRKVFGAGEPDFSIAFRTQRALRRSLKSGFLGFGESYMAGEIDVEGNWDRFFALAMSSSLEHVVLPIGSLVRFLLVRLRTRDTKHRSRANIVRHYDLGNDFYKLWLDESLTYSCAYFRSPDDALETAQAAKLDLICRKLRLQPGQTLLDVGCGWGSLLIHAVRRYDVQGVGCTLSENQARLAAQRVREAGLEKQVEIRLQDYRDVAETFDRWVSVGMAEHVGKAFLPRFIEHISRRLRPGGVGLLHFIGKDRTGFGDPWTLTYIFPGGYLPSLPETLRLMGRHDLRTVDVENLRPHYALTLDRWHDRFERHVEEIRTMYDDRFVRMWRLFLVSSAAGFRYGNTRVFQILFSNGPTDELPLIRSDAG